MKKNLRELFDQMTPEELEPFSDAFSAPDLPPETLSSVKEKVYAKTGMKTGKKRLRKRRYRLGVLAACVALILGAVILVPMQRGVPVWENAHYRAADIALLFDETKDAVSTNAYTKLYVPDTQYLYIKELPEDDYLGVYQYRAEKKALDREEFEAFLQGVLTKLTPAIDAEIPSYEIEEKDNFEKCLEIYEHIGSYRMLASQNEICNRFHLFAPSETDEKKIVLDGVPVQIDQRLSDEEIINALQPVKAILFDLFGVSFPDVKLLRTFGSQSEHGAEWIEVYFYDEAAHMLNQMQESPVTDCIAIVFENMKNYASDTVSDGVLTVDYIDYRQYRGDASKAYALIANAKRISLKDAETLLYKGYVFGGHSCPRCMAAQDKISFEGYDFVNLEYVIGYDYKEDRPTTGIPFYAFYKNIGKAYNGNTVYAKTYVPAIEVKELEEYFQSQTKNHRTGGTATIE